MVEKDSDTLHVDIWYPYDHPLYVQLGLSAVRAADDIRVSYDLDRDGWKIEQAKYHEWPMEGDCDPGWTEVAFVQAWALETRHPALDGAP
jgi:hypothetical protein